MRRTSILRLAAMGLGLTTLWAAAASPAAEPKAACTLQTQYLKYSIGADGASLQWIDNRDNTNHCPLTRPPFAWVSKAGKLYRASSVRLAEGTLNVEFAGAGRVTAYIINMRAGF